MLTSDSMTGLELHEVLHYWATRQPEAEFAQFGEQCTTYAEARAAANRLANAFVEAGLTPGARVAILARNCIEYALLYFAASTAGVVLVPLNYRSAPAEWAYVLNDAEVALLLAAEEFLPAVDALRAELLHVRRFVALGQPVLAWVAYAEWVAEQSATAPWLEHSNEADLCQLYTSGTTGHPRGAILSQRALMWNLIQIGTSAHGAHPGERSLVVAPMLHAGVVWSTLAPLARGASLYIMESFDAPAVVRALDRERIGFAVLVPTMLQACVGVHGAAERRYDALRLIHSGSAPLAVETLRRAQQVFRCDVLHGYGLTESTAAVSAMEPADYELAAGTRPELLASVGRPLLGTSVQIVDEVGQVVPTGASGEVVVRGPQLMRGYWRQPHATEMAIRAGWLHTGDVGHVDADGYLFITDRVKDVIVSGGINVYPRMVERALEAHPAVAEVAVIGVPDPRWGERVHALVVPRVGHDVSSDELMTFAGQRLGGFQRPRGVEFVASLPRTTSGKVLKRVLREAYWADQSRRVGAV